MFLDKIKIICKAGNGGNGKVNFRREKSIPNGGPDGGDGGRGGSIIFKATNQLSNLVEFRYKKVFKAEDGESGGKRNRIGKSADDMVIFVPKGTVIKNGKTMKVIADMLEDGQEFVALKGGKPGRGNTKFATATRQAPNFAELGDKTEEFELWLELKTVADVGLIGFPNVGKSSLLAAVSNARPKIANYHFTTLIPNVGVVKANSGTSVWADIPGLIEGASEGVGLGLDFLKHIERTRLLIHVLDAAGSEGRDPYEDYLIINKELENYGDKVKNTPQIIALNKIDLIEDKQVLEDLKQKIGADKQIFEISAVGYMNLDALIEAVVEKLKTIPKKEAIVVEETNIDRKLEKTLFVEKLGHDYYEVYGTLIDDIVKGVNINDYYSNGHFQKRLIDDGVIAKLIEHGMKEGDTIKIAELEFEYVI